MEDRIRFYLGAERNFPVVVRHDDTQHGIGHPIRYCYSDFFGKPFPPGRKTTYYHDLTRAVHYLPHLHRSSFLFYPHDRVEPFDVPTLVKSRPITGYGQSVLFNMNYMRHFADVYRVDEADVSFEEKADVLVWRGADTGYGFGNDIPPRPVSREVLLEKYAGYSGGRIDVGLTGVSVNRKGEKKSQYDRFLKPKVVMKDMLRNKFLLSVEGNDVATNLKWILHSNSVPFCPPFTMNSWLMEEKLRPWEHYVPVRHDFSDLEERVAWAVGHPQQCGQIARNGRAYMRQFLDADQEALVVRAVLEEYAKNVKIVA